MQPGKHLLIRAEAYKSMKNNIERSSLIMPINVPRFVERAWTRGVEQITLDLEDSVAPNQKEDARKLVRNSIRIAARGGASVSVRINNDSIEKDLEASVWPGLDSILMTKVESPDEIRMADSYIGKLELKRGINKGSIKIKPLIESAKGVWQSYDIATSSERIIQFGDVAPGDTTADLGIEMAGEVDQLFYCRGEVDLIGRSLNKGAEGPWQAIEGSLFQYGDPEPVLRKAQENRRRGIHGSFGIHPSVVQPNNVGLTPTTEEVQEAKDLIKYFEETWARGESYCVFKGRMIFKHNAQWAREYIKYADSCSAKDEEKAELIKQLQKQERCSDEKING